MRHGQSAIRVGIVLFCGMELARTASFSHLFPGVESPTGGIFTFKISIHIIHTELNNEDVMMFDVSPFLFTPFNMISTLISIDFHIFNMISSPLKSPGAPQALPCSPPSCRSSKDRCARRAAQAMASASLSVSASHAPRSSCSELRGATSAMDVAARSDSTGSPRCLGERPAEAMGWMDGWMLMACCSYGWFDVDGLMKWLDMVVDEIF